MKRTVAAWRQWAQRLRNEVYAVYLACRDPRVPWYARVLAGCLVAYAFSPIDLIPDFIPVLGHLDELVILPLGMWLVVRLIPEPVLEDCRAKARAITEAGRPRRWAAAAVIVAVWALLLTGGIALIVRIMRR